MSATGFLDRDQLRTLTNTNRRAVQEAWLRSEGIPFKISRKDELLVCWKHVHSWIEGRHQPVASRAPNLSVVT
jgi:hypothetical protein